MKLKKGWDDSSDGLKCPFCGEPNLHQGTVEIFNREDEDSDNGLHVRGESGRPLDPPG